jgi:hypothetical protein
MAVSAVEHVSADPATDIRRLNHFFVRRRRRHGEKDDPSVHFRLRRLEGRLTRRSLESRFQRYVLDTTWDEWVDYEVDDHLQESTRPKKLVRALASRIALSDDLFDRLLPRLVTGASETGAMSTFGEALSKADIKCRRLRPLLSLGNDPNHSQCVGGYLASLKMRDPDRWQSELLGLFANESTAALGADLVWRSGFDNQVLNAWLDSFERGWVEASTFQCLCFGMAWQRVPLETMTRLLAMLSDCADRDSAYVQVDLLDQVLKGEVWPVDADLVFKVVTAPVHFEDAKNTMHAYHWHGVCKKLVARDAQKAMRLLDVLLRQMGIDYALSYDHYVEPFAQTLCRINPIEAWGIVVSHLLSAAPKWRGDLLNWLKGGLGDFDKGNSVPPIAEFPLKTVLDWIAEDPENRASMIAHCAPRSLDDEYGGAVTKALLVNYRNVDGVAGGISANFHSGSWTGPMSQHLRKERDRYRGWLGKGFDQNVVSWIEDEITSLDRSIEAAEISEERESWNRPSRA